VMAASNVMLEACRIGRPKGSRPARVSRWG
jgi:hypothetical protein